MTTHTYRPNEHGTHCADCGWNRDALIHGGQPLTLMPLPDPCGTPDMFDSPCEACGAEAGEKCRPMCLGEAAHLDEIGDGRA